MARGHQEKAEHVIAQIASTNKRSLPPGKLVDIDAKVSAPTQSGRDDFSSMIMDFLYLLAQA